ncbi:hypothetical protein ACLB2K_027177 [Fragaria x ananassa]
MFDWILNRAQERYKDWKYQCHKAYLKEGPSGMPSDFIGREDQWEFLCEHFESDAFKRLFLANKRNRGEKTMHHHRGSSSIIYTMEELGIQGEQLPIIKGFEKTYVRAGDEDTKQGCLHERPKVHACAPQDACMRSLGACMRAPGCLHERFKNDMVDEINKPNDAFKEQHPDAMDEEIMESVQCQQIEVLGTVLKTQKRKEIRGMGQEGERDLSHSSKGSTSRSRRPRVDEQHLQEMQERYERRLNESEERAQQQFQEVQQRALRAESIYSVV